MFWDFLPYDQWSLCNVEVPDFFFIYSSHLLIDIRKKSLFNLKGIKMFRQFVNQVTNWALLHIVVIHLLLFCYVDIGNETFEV